MLTPITRIFITVMSIEAPAPWGPALTPLTHVAK
jgi:hypothetical protein